MFGAGLLTPPGSATAGLPHVSETCGRAPWLGPPLLAAVPETGHNFDLEPVGDSSAPAAKIEPGHFDSSMAGASVAGHGALC
jgi:hypothetical protein